MYNIRIENKTNKLKTNIYKAKIKSYTSNRMVHKENNSFGYEMSSVRMEKILSA
jgi:hypothetical protein